MSDEVKLKQLEDDLFCNLRAELKIMLAVNKIDTDLNNGISYKSHIEILQEQLEFFKVEIIEKNLQLISSLK